MSHRRPSSFFALVRLCFAAVVAFSAPAAFAGEVVPPTGVLAKDEFSRLVRLAPFVVRGQQLSVSIHARSGRDRSYGEEFAEEVLRVVWEAGVTDSTGKGLVIVGKKGEPHPIRFFRKFLALADAGALDPAIAARGPELFKMLDHWEHSSDKGRGAGEKQGGNVDLEFERIVTALPLPLEGIGAQLYQLAWFEKFDDARVEAKLRALRAADLERDLFAHYDWVFYLPPKGAFDDVLDGIISDALKDGEVGIVGRMAVKGVMLVVKPKIRKAIEGVRKGLMFQTVVQARTRLGEDAVSRLMGAYVEELMPDLPDEPKHAGPEHERAVAAVRAELGALRAAAAKTAAEPAATPVH
ncbi:MAG: hypothetical protein HYV96_15490 [Opitutae bacterium]|nr:hypothetical protein [Opitutae bacterium]